MCKFPNVLSSIPSLQDDKEDVSHDVGALFTSILMEETINYIIEQINIQKVNTSLFETDFEKVISKTCYRMYF